MVFPDIRTAAPSRQERDKAPQSIIPKLSRHVGLTGFYREATSLGAGKGTGRHAVGGSVRGSFVRLGHIWKRDRRPAGLISMLTRVGKLELVGRQERRPRSPGPLASEPPRPHADEGLGSVYASCIDPLSRNIGHVGLWKQQGKGVTASGWS